MEKKMDLRIFKTYKALTNAFFDLLKEKRFEDITINELCERAVIRRTTFYKHFADKYEFVTFIAREFHRENETFMDLITPEGSLEIFENIVDSILDGMERNKQVLQSLLKSSALPILMDIFSDEVAAGLEEKLQQLNDNGVVLPIEPVFLAQVLSGALMQSTKWWISQNNRISKAAIRQQLLHLMLVINETIKSKPGTPVC